MKNGEIMVKNFINILEKNGIKKVLVKNGIMILMLTVITLSFSNTYVNATTGGSAEELIDTAGEFINEGANSGTRTIDMSKVVPVFLSFGQFLSGIAIVTLLIVTGIMGIKFMLAGPEQRAGLQKQLVGLLIATFVIFGAYIIWSIAVKLLTASTTGV